MCMSVFKYIQVKSYRIKLCHLLHILCVVGPSEGSQAIRVQLATLRVQLLTVLIGELRAKAVQCDDESSAISFKLGKENTVEDRYK